MNAVGSQEEETVIKFEEKLLRRDEWRRGDRGSPFLFDKSLEMIRKDFNSTRE